MELVTLPDIVGNGAAVALAASGFARAIFITATGGNARLGDSNVAAAQGVELVQNVPSAFYADPNDMTARFDLSKTKAYVPNGATLTVSYGA